MSRRDRNVRNKMARSRKRLAYGFIGFFSILLIYAAFYHSSSNINVPKSSNLKAAIVDHLSLSVPNQTFIQTTTTILEKAGYTVDYYLGEEVNVEFYRELPTHGYGLLILRVHSGLMRGSSTLGLFTSERYEQSKYIYEQLTDQLWGAVYSEEEREKGIIYFGISPLFVKHSMKGRFQNSIIIMMGCDGLTYADMAEAFIEKGAKVYISWSQQVLASHTDLTTICLLQHFLIEKRTLKDAVRETLKEVGFDPAYKSLLIYYPLEAGEYTYDE